ncbi:MAG: hypothetical protein U0168_22480 [Nannocystaceae bacterium]
MVKRAVVSSARRTIAARPGTSDDVVPLDDRPLSLTMSADGKRVLVALPYEIAVFHAESLELEKSIELASAEPSLCLADDDGGLWIGGQHLHRGSIWSAKAEKFGSKLGGFVDRVVLLRPRLLCGVGTQGELLLDLEKEEVLHRRKVPERDVFGLVGGADGRALARSGAGDGRPRRRPGRSELRTAAPRLGARSRSPSSGYMSSSSSRPAPHRCRPRRSSRSVARPLGTACWRRATARSRGPTARCG